MEKNTKIEVSDRKSYSMKLDSVDIMAGDNDYIEVTNWANGEGWDVTIYYKEIGEKHFSLSFGAFDALQTLINVANIGGKVNIEYNE